MKINRKKINPLPDDVKLLLKKGKKEGKISQEELMAVLPKAEEDIELLDRIYNKLMQMEIELVDTLFTDTWSLLEAYDRGAIETHSIEDYKVELDMNEIVEILKQSVRIFRNSRIEKGEAGELFGQEREKGSLEGIIKDIFQSWDQEDLYKTVEEKAAHLLYFIIKNHPFIDGNKRCGAFAFIFFIQRTKIFDIERITSQTLSIITLLVAESDPRNKNLMIQVIIHIILTLLIKK